MRLGNRRTPTIDALNSQALEMDALTRWLSVPRPGFGHGCTREEALVECAKNTDILELTLDADVLRKRKHSTHGHDAKLTSDMDALGKPDVLKPRA